MAPSIPLSIQPKYYLSFIALLRYMCLNHFRLTNLISHVTCLFKFLWYEVHSTQPSTHSLCHRNKPCDLSSQLRMTAIIQSVWLTGFLWETDEGVNWETLLWEPKVMICKSETFLFFKTCFQNFMNCSSLVLICVRTGQISSSPSLPSKSQSAQILTLS